MLQKPSFDQKTAHILVKAGASHGGYIVLEAAGDVAVLVPVIVSLDGDL